MTCQRCGRPAEDGTPTHWLGCKQAEAPEKSQAVAELDKVLDAMCDFPGCEKPKKEWSGRGARPKYCAEGHK